MSALAESASIKAMAEKIERLEKELATWQSASHLPSQLGDFARILRLTPQCQARLIAEISGSLFDATDGLDAVKKAKLA